MTSVLAAEGGYQEFVMKGGEWAILAFSGVAAILAVLVGFALMRGVLAADQGTPKNHPGENAQEIIRLAGLGLSPAAALLASTAWAAELLRISDRAGRIRPGLAADLLVLDTDPLADIGVLANQSAIRAVIQAGAIVRSSLPEIEGNT